MPRVCTVCRHADREPLERAMLAGESYRNIAARFGTSTSALVRHRQEHLSHALTKAQDAIEVTRADNLLSDVRNGEDRAERLYCASEAILKRALQAKDLRTALQAIRAAAMVMAEGRQYLELRGDLTGELDACRLPQTPRKIQILALPRCDGVSSREREPVKPEALLQAVAALSRQ